MATADTTILTENEQLAGINADYEQRYGFHDAVEMNRLIELQMEGSIG